MTMVGSMPEGALLADAGNLPLEDESVDGAFCSNLLEHTPDAEAVIARDRARAAPGRLGLHLVDQLVLALGRARHDALPVPRSAARTAALRAPPRRPRARTPTARGCGRCTSGPTIRLVRRRPRLGSSGSSRATGPGSLHLPGAAAARGAHLELRDPGRQGLTVPRSFGARLALIAGPRAAGAGARHRARVPPLPGHRRLLLLPPQRQRAGGGPRAHRPVPVDARPTPIRARFIRRCGPSCWRRRRSWAPRASWPTAWSARSRAR